LEDMHNAFLIQKLPPMWDAVSYPCLKPLNSWVTDYLARIEFMSKWLLSGPPTSFWVPCFFFPQGFMTAGMQVHARKTRIPIDTLTFWPEVSQITDSYAAVEQRDGVNVHGFFMQGAGWKLECYQMRESEIGVLYVELPVILLKPVQLDEFVKLQQTNRYLCPVYKTSERKGILSSSGHSTNFITYFQLASDVSDNDHWVRRGVALLCMLDD